MAIDFIILSLLILSLLINCLALAAFWVTPGLRTTANRFVINLLIINIFGCITLAPTLLLRSTEFKYEKLNEKLIINKNNNINEYELNKLNYINDINNNNNNKKFNIKESLLKCNNNKNKCDEITATIYNQNDNELNVDGNVDELETTIVITEMDIVIKDKKNYKQNNFNNDAADQGKKIPTITENLGKYNEKNIQKQQNNNNILLKNHKKWKHVNKEFKEQNFEVNKNNNDNVVVGEDNVMHNKNIIDEPQIENNIRCWSIDLTAALGALSVLLVVTDTWCAVTDPLRYHSRISGLKAWILIGITWILGIFFGIFSALRETTITTKEISLKDENENEIFITEQDSLYTIIYSCIYFILIILLPFGCVCFMYWRIFTEARENGLRMRQNGSSPLLQSALNLSGHHNNQQISHINNNNNNNPKDPHHLSINYNGSNHNNNNRSSINLNKHHRSNSGGLQMRIDHNDKDSTIKPHLLVPLVHQKSSITNHDRNQNILLTFSAATNNDIKRNYSSRQLAVLGSSQDLIDCSNLNGIRQVHSTPNLQKYHRNSDGSLDEILHNRHALRLPQAIHHQNTSPKALSYMTSIRHRLSNASSLFKYREESRAARISILVVIMFLVSYLPYGILVLLEGRLFNLTQHGTQLAIFVVILGNLSSPIIFAYRNKRVRRGVKRIFNLDPRAKDRKLQRHGIISQYNQNGLLKTKIKSSNSLNVKHCKNKISTFTINSNSCKYLTPHTVVGTFLIDLEKCNLSNDLTMKTNNGIKINCHIDEEDDEEDEDDDLSDKSAVISINGALAGDNSIAEKRSLLKIVCDSSKKLGCANGQSCTSSDCEIEPTDV